MIIFLTGLATMTALVSCDVIRVLQPDKALPRAVVMQLVHLAQLA
jgi:hypothetical protein